MIPTQGLENREPSRERLMQHSIVAEQNKNAKLLGK
jgi:hypothetical protein